MTKNIEPFYGELGRRIQAVRKRQGITQDQLGQALRPPRTRVSVANVEAGNQRILAHTLVQLAEALKVEPVELLPLKKDEVLPTNRELADELVSKAGFSKKTAEKLLESPQNFKTWEEPKS
jgi:transcriptional regulator with XRE-family HTH domain